MGAAAGSGAAGGGASAGGAGERLLAAWGAPPPRGEASFGYLKRGPRLADRLYRVAQFTEKPDAARAEAWVAAGEYAWNASIFVWEKRTFMDALAAGRPAIAEAFRGLAFSAGQEQAFESALASRFPGVESVSVDYAVLEVAPNVVMFEAAFDWDDLGSWRAWARHQPQDARGNVTWGQAVPLDCDRCVV